MPSTYEITKVRTVRTYGTAHEHISMVELNNDASSRWSREAIIRDLRNPYGDRYYTYGGGQYATVIVAGCPYCTSGDYLTTEPDSTTQNNLLSLPRF